MIAVLLNNVLTVPGILLALITVATLIVLIFKSIVKRDMFYAAVAFFALLLGFLCLLSLPSLLADIQPLINKVKGMIP